MEKVNTSSKANPKNKALSNNINTFIFQPDIELLDFAKQFSSSYKILSVGDYVSDNRKYHIKYMEIVGSGDIGARVSNVTGIIQIDKTFLNKEVYTPDFAFFIILWGCACYYFKDIKLADKIAVNYYLTTARSKKDLALGCSELLKNESTKLNVERYKLISKMLFN